MLFGEMPDAFWIYLSDCFADLTMFKQKYLPDFLAISYKSAVRILVPLIFSIVEKSYATRPPLNDNGISIF